MASNSPPKVAFQLYSVQWSAFCNDKRPRCILVKYSSAHLFRYGQLATVDIAVPVTVLNYISLIFYIVIVVVSAKLSNQLLQINQLI